MDRKISKKKIKKLLIILDFLIMFNLLAIPMYLAIYFNFEFKPLRETEAYLSSLLLKLFNIPSKASGTSILIKKSTTTYGIDVSWDSTGWKSIYAYFCLIIATPVFLNKKIFSLILGITLIFFINLVRIVSTVAVSFNLSLSYFGFLHTLLWREGMISIVLVFWFIWLLKEKNNIGKKLNIIR